MPVWDPAQYLQFSDHRARPFVDLIARIDIAPRTIVDLGCGPGHLTQVLRARWPDAAIHGVDSSAEMIEEATARNTDAKATYELADVSTWSPADRVDLIVANALFQWVPQQLAVIQRLAERVAPGGAFALQVPRNYSSPSHTLLSEISSQPPFAEHTAGIVADRGTEPTDYLELFSRLGWNVDLWETTYFHVLDGPDPVFDWISGTGARPYVQALPAQLRRDFGEKYRLALRSAYPRKDYGTVFPFRRTQVVAHSDRGLR